MVFIGLLPRDVSACSCAYPDSVKAELDRKTAVFTGKVIDIVEEKQSIALNSSADPIKVLFEVNESWKGVNSSQTIVRTARDDASCGYEFEKNKEYIVYAYGDNDNLETGYCERTTLLSDASEDLEILGQGKKPTEEVDLQDELGKSNLPIYIFIIVIVLVGGYFIGKKMKKA